MSAGPIMIMAGGTGGHVFPGLAVAQALRERHGAVVWLGTRRGFEARVVPQAGIEIEWISISGLRGRGWLAWAAAPFKIAIAITQVLATLRRRRPSAVLGMGGFVSGPGGVAAWLARRPLLIHEQNAVAGTTNRWLARLARRVFEAFPGSFPSGVRTELVGNPVRRSIADLAPPRERFAARAGQRPRVLVLGGSQGARVLNRTVPEALALLAPPLRPDVWHQGGRGVEEARAAYATCKDAAHATVKSTERSNATGITTTDGDAATAERPPRAMGEDAITTGAGAITSWNPRVDAFIDDVAEAYAWADLVVARAGALTVSELAVAGVGAILVPFPYAIDDHQTRNAEQFVASGAGVVIAERDLTPARLAAELERLLGAREKLLALAEAARSQARLGAAERLASACLALAEVES